MKRKLHVLKRKHRQKQAVVVAEEARPVLVALVVDQAQAADREPVAGQARVVSVVVHQAEPVAVHVARVVHVNRCADVQMCK
jgi:hypothetical protein